MSQDAMQSLQNLVLEMVARGDPLGATLDRMCTEVERKVPDLVCSILAVDRDATLRPLSGPSLPAAYSAALDGLAIGPDVGSCGSAAYFGRPVTVTDIETDHRWERYRHLALPLGLKACWSSPILGSDGTVLGTFAFYFREKRGPREIEKTIVDTCVHLCAIALERHRRVLERERKANIDELTQLKNRRAFEAAIDRLSDGTSEWALLAIDLDNLKTVNDTFGHQTGDALIRTVAERVAETVRPEGAYRIGGDEFAVVVETASGLADSEGLAERIIASVSVATVCDGHAIIPKATIGIAHRSTADSSANDVRREADFALYHAKATRRGGAVRYWAGIGTTITRRLDAIREAGAALREHRVEVHYQPVVRVDTRDVVGLEALCRIRRPDGEIVPAASFFEALSDVHVAVEITHRVVTAVARDIRYWLDLGIPVQHVGINVSSADFHGGDLLRQITTAFALENVPLAHLVLEVTEAVYLGQGDPIVAREIKSIREAGLRIALDDFGTGYASLTHLLTVPVDILKIDKTFIDRLKQDNRSLTIVAGVIAIARGLDIRVVAEGIEDEEQASLLLQAGCRLGQGYLFSRPADRQRTTQILLSSAQRPERQASETSAAGAGAEPMRAGAAS